MNTTKPCKYRYISGDSHLEIDSKPWISRIPDPYRDKAPRLVRLPEGADAWVVGDLPPRRAAAADLYGGKGRDAYVPFGAIYEGTPGTGSPEQRLQEQDQDGIDAEVLFPSQQGGPRLWRQVKDDNAYRAIVHAHNSWLIEEYCSVDADRLIGMGIIPATNLEDAVSELSYCAQAGFKGVLLLRFPSGKSHPTPDDDRFWATALELDMPVTVHVDLERTPGEPLLLFPDASEEMASKVSGGLVEQVARFGPSRGSGAVPAVQMVLAGVFDRFPSLRVLFAENQIGWIPFFLQSADVRYDRHHHWAERLLGFKPLHAMPSDYIRQHCLWGFQFDRVGVELRHTIGVKNLLWGSDFPHQESDWPHSMDVIEHNFVDVPEDERYRMVAGNAIDFFHLNEVA